MRDACGIVSAKLSLSDANSQTADTPKQSQSGRVTASIETERKGTRPPLKTDSPDTLVFDLRTYFGGTVVI